MITDYQIKDEKLQCDINRVAAKIFALSPGKINKYEYLTGEEICLRLNSPLGKTFEKKTKQLKIKDKKEFML